MSTITEIPFDVYESPQELVLIMPLGGVKKNSLEIKIEDYRVVIRGVRETVKLKSSFTPLKEECYWGKIEKKIDLPPNVYFDKIHSKLSPENILEIIIPKTSIPEKVALKIESGR